MDQNRHLDAHEKPPLEMRDVFKKYQRMSSDALSGDADILDFSRDLITTGKTALKIIGSFSKYDTSPLFNEFSGIDTVNGEDGLFPLPIYEHDDMPGLQIIPNLIPQTVQRTLLSRLIHRDLSNPQHKTNIHKFYTIPYPEHDTSFFSYAPTPQSSSTYPIFSPLDPTIHKPFTPASFLNSKLRWMTLGGQYDWTAKVYPSDAPPPFPPDIRQLLEGLWPSMKPQAAIVNFYSPGDRLSVHRDVSEECDRPLVSVSIGCDAVFVCGLEGPRSETGQAKSCKPLAIRLGSGDAVVMSGLSRFAWHGVPLVLKGTCPVYLESWPARAEGDAGSEQEDEYEAWRNWMMTKRINLNVRQMWA